MIRKSRASAIVHNTAKQGQKPQRLLHVKGAIYTGPTPRKIVGFRAFALKPNAGPDCTDSLDSETSHNHIGCVQQTIRYFESIWDSPCLECGRKRSFKAPRTPKLTTCQEHSYASQTRNPSAGTMYVPPNPASAVC